MKPQHHLSSFRRVLKPCPSKIAHILGRSSLKFQNLRDGSSLEVSFKRFYELEVFFSNWGLRFDCWLRRRPRIRRLVQGGFAQKFNLAEIVSVIWGLQFAYQMFRSSTVTLSIVHRGLFSYWEHPLIYMRFQFILESVKDMSERASAQHLTGTNVRLTTVCPFAGSTKYLENLRSDDSDMIVVEEARLLWCVL